MNEWVNSELFGTILVSIGLIGFLAAMGHTAYLAWFHPDKYKERAVKSVKDWWPFASYFRHHHGSNEFLWAARIGPIIFLIIFLSLGVLGILGYLGFFP
jgi:hypothetical protein